MSKQIFFILSILLSYIPYFYAMEIEKQNNQKIMLTIKKPKELTIIPINNGLHTKVKEGKIAQITFDSDSGDVLSTRIITRQATFVNLINYTKQLSSKDPNPTLESFLPIILRESINNIYNMPFVDLGLFSKQKHFEAIKALEENRALYCSYRQGVIIYNPEKQPDPNNYKEKLKHYIDIDQRLKPKTINNALLK